VLPRIASFIGSTNQSTFLQDETGSVRWLCFTVDSIDFSYKKEFKIEGLWAQAYHLSKSNSFDETMTREDIQQNELRNKKYQISTTEHQMLFSYFEKPTNGTGEFLTSADIVNYITLTSATRLRLTTVNMGKALTKEGFEKKTANGRSLYLVNKRSKFVTFLNSNNSSENGLALFFFSKLFKRVSLHIFLTSIIGFLDNILNS